MIDPRDEGDIAQDYQTRLNAAGVAASRAEMNRQQVAPTLEICVDCENEIPPARREAQKGCTRCAECQTLFERLGGGL